MRILHLGIKLPDARVEKSIISDMKRGGNVALAITRGSEFAVDQNLDIIKSYFEFGFWQQIKVKKNPTYGQINHIISEFDPDLIHAHDIYNASIADKLDLPIIYNDHEAWLLKINATIPIHSKRTVKYWKRLLGIFFRRRLIERLENWIIPNNVTITVSENITNYHRENGGECFTVHNYPMEREIDQDVLPEKVKGTVVYVGRDISFMSGPFRDTTGFKEILYENDIKLVVIGDKKLEDNDKLTSLGFVQHSHLNELIKPYEYGALAYNPHPFHFYADHIKTYNYLHAGMHVLAPSSFDLPHIPYMLYYNDITQIPSLINSHRSEDPEEIKSYASKHFIWENDEKNI